MRLDRWNLWARPNHSALWLCIWQCVRGKAPHLLLGAADVVVVAAAAASSREHESSRASSTHHVIRRGLVATHHVLIHPSAGLAQDQI